MTALGVGTILFLWVLTLSFCYAIKPSSQQVVTLSEQLEEWAQQPYGPGVQSLISIMTV